MLRPDQKLSGLEFRLPTPLRIRHVRVEVFWSDGGPARGADVFATTEGKSAGHEVGRGEETFVELKLIEGLDYRINARWTPESGRSRAVDSEIVPLSAGRESAIVRVRLKEREEAGFHKLTLPQGR